jgi:hypothetical protein
MKTAEVLRAWDDPTYFAESPYFLGLKLFPKQAEVLKTFYESGKRELILIAGFKSGKSTLAAVIACYEAFRLLCLPDPAQHYGLQPGELIFIVTVAVSEEQGRDTIFQKVLSLIQRSEFFKSFRPKVYQTEIRFPSKNVAILCGTSSSASLVGRTVKAAIFDELSRFEESSSKRGAWNVYNSLKHMTFWCPDGKVVCISSPRHQSDIIMELYRQSLDHPQMVGFKFATWEFNPRISFDSLRPEMERDPVRFWTDFGAEPIESITPFITDDTLKVGNTPNLLRLFAEGVHVDFEPGTYALAGDPAVRRDAFGLALTRYEKDRFVVVGTYRFKPSLNQPINPVAVKDFIKEIVKRTRARVVFDTWQYPELQNEIRMLGVPVTNHVVGLEDYEYFRELCYLGKVELCRDNHAVQEFRQLRVINNKKIDHPPGGSKDVADAVVNSIWVLKQPAKQVSLGVVTTF